MSIATTGSRYDDYGVVDIDVTPEAVQARQNDVNLALYLERASTAELARVANALATECSVRGIQVMGKLGAAIGIIESRAEMEASAPCARCEGLKRAVGGPARCLVHAGVRP